MNKVKIILIFFLIFSIFSCARQGKISPYKNYPTTYPKDPDTKLIEKYKKKQEALKSKKSNY